MTSNCRDILTEATRQLHSDSARLDAGVLLSHVLQKPNTFLIAHPEHELNTQQQHTFRTLIEKRRQGHPVAHLTGHREFWSLDLHVDDNTLIPRPETETLVEQALQLIPLDAPMDIADLGTGSGAIAIAIACERPRCNLYATDCSETALQVAAKNAHRLADGRIQFHQGNWFDALPDKLFDLVVSNPPYIALDDPHLTQGDVAHEPALALSSGEDGLNAIRLIIEQAKIHLNPAGHVLIEHGYSQQGRILTLLSDHGYLNTRGFADLAGNPRVVQAQWRQ